MFNYKELMNPESNWIKVKSTEWTVTIGKRAAISCVRLEPRWYNIEYEISFALLNWENTSVPFVVVWKNAYGNLRFLPTQLLNESFVGVRHSVLFVIDLDLTYGLGGRFVAWSELCNVPISLDSLVKFYKLVRKETL